LVDFYALKTHAESMPRRLFLEADIHLHVCRRIKQRPCQVCCLDVSILLAMCYIDSVILAGPLNYPRAGPPLSKMGRGFHFEFALRSSPCPVHVLRERRPAKCSPLAPSLLRLQPMVPEKIHELLVVIRLDIEENAHPTVTASGC